MQNLICAAVLGVIATSVAFGEELKNGTFYPLEKVPAELIARSPAGTPVRFVMHAVSRGEVFEGACDRFVRRSPRSRMNKQSAAFQELVFARSAGKFAKICR